jgi:hypothetical protein
LRDVAEGGDEGRGECVAKRGRGSWGEGKREKFPKTRQAVLNWKGLVNHDD